ncbi:hypothetical protein BJ508DRAFT_371730 [Ascobolus immersus RN42]|uniref:Uncharacterized protein n=1 Tax=Ascobolus immersus RN42 TaxID=1160509 RepID=A0A3N4IQ70_ASCIM|nr:hypothetical protein BJ508DRAFT_371730 [Ascobolus immersus RN42]
MTTSAFLINHVYTVTIEVVPLPLDPTKPGFRKLVDVFANVELANAAARQCALFGTYENEFRPSKTQIEKGERQTKILSRDLEYLVEGRAKLSLANRYFDHRTGALTYTLIVKECPAFRGFPPIKGRRVIAHVKREELMDERKPITPAMAANETRFLPKSKNLGRFLDKRHRAKLVDPQLLSNSACTSRDIGPSLSDSSTLVSPTSDTPSINSGPEESQTPSMDSLEGSIGSIDEITNQQSWFPNAFPEECEMAGIQKSGDNTQSAPDSRICSPTGPGDDDLIDLAGFEVSHGARDLAGLVRDDLSQSSISTKRACDTGRSTHISNWEQQLAEDHERWKSNGAWRKAGHEEEDSSSETWHDALPATIADMDGGDIIRKNMEKYHEQIIESGKDSMMQLATTSSSEASSSPQVAPGAAGQSTIANSHLSTLQELLKKSNLHNDLRPETFGEFAGLRICQFLHDIECAEVNSGLDSADIAKFLPRCLLGNAALWFRGLPIEKQQRLVSSLDEFYNALYEEFSYLIPKEKAEALDYHYDPAHHMSIRSYYYTKILKLRQTDPRISDDDVLDLVWKGLQRHAPDLARASAGCLTLKELKDTLFTTDYVPKTRKKSKKVKQIRGLSREYKLAYTPNGADEEDVYESCY